MSNPIDFATVARVPLEGDNVAIATQHLAAGTQITLGDELLQLNHDVLEGHRFAIRPIPANTPLLSWQLPFAIALSDIAAGDAVMNASTVDELASRQLNLPLPTTPNFRDYFEPYQFNAAQFEATAPLPQLAEQRTFNGYRRDGNRGVGTRNVIILLGTNADSAGFVNALETQLAPLVAQHPTLDGIKAIAHTEGSTAQANNRALVLRTLAGYMVHANVAAVLAVDYGHGAITNAALQQYMRDNAYALAAVPHAFMTVRGDFASEQQRAEQLVNGWLPLVGRMEKSAESISHLKIALQCGGSDAFSGISGNPLIGHVAHQLIQHGGSAVLAETDELIGAESYVVAKAHSATVVQRFLTTVERFKGWAARHGVSPEGNPSGGNRLRGLYNIALKSIGAAMKKHPDTPLAGVLEYSEPVNAPGYYFMDSPGNDLESIAGQIGSGCNLIFFVTGNGSITNFPFVPTLKVVTTSARFAQLESDMDINAGSYLSGTSMDALGAATFEQMLATASGQLSKGERAGHTQVQLWRDWPIAANTQPVTVDSIPDGEPHLASNSAESLPTSIKALQTKTGVAFEQVGLILPTSLCSGQIAQMMVDQLNASGLQHEIGLSRFVTLVHTEGCGVSNNAAPLHNRTLLNYICHRAVGRCLLLEHGCEKTHNDYFKQRLQEASIADTALGFASIQGDGGIASVMQKMAQWFCETASEPQAKASVGLDQLRIGIACYDKLGDCDAALLEQLVRSVVGAGGTVVLAACDVLLDSAEFFPTANLTPTLAHGQRSTQPGLHVMQMASPQWSETITGLGTTVDILIGITSSYLPHGHPLVPMLRIAATSKHNQPTAIPLVDFDAHLNTSSIDSLLDLIAATLSDPKSSFESNSLQKRIQLSRGLSGISL